MCSLLFGNNLGARIVISIISRDLYFGLIKILLTCKMFFSSMIRRFSPLPCPICLYFRLFQIRHPLISISLLSFLCFTSFAFTPSFILFYFCQVTLSDGLPGLGREIFFLQNILRPMIVGWVASLVLVMHSFTGFTFRLKPWLARRSRLILNLQTR
jgi:hypothetical protein